MKLIIDMPENLAIKLGYLSRERGLSKAAITRWALYDLFRKELKDDGTAAN